PAQPGDPDAREHVSCGVPLPGTELAIVDPETTCSRPEKMVGEIWLRGQCVTKGYWNRPNETLEAFGAHTADGVGPWLRTGDFGFVCEGELYVTGRLKDLIINFGKKYSPVDIERAAERAEPRLRPGCTIAFSVSMDGSEGLVLVAATRKHEPGAAEAIAAVVRRAIASEFQL